MGGESDGRFLKWNGARPAKILLTNMGENRANPIPVPRAPHPTAHRTDTDPRPGARPYWPVEQSWGVGGVRAASSVKPMSTAGG
eukprot:12029896-Alexandrium_andersonii.AAC.1